MDALIQSLRKKSEESNKKYISKLNEEVEAIIFKIRNFEDKENKQEYVYSGSMSEYVEKRLVEMGFSVRNSWNFNDNSYIISWKEK